MDEVRKISRKIYRDQTTFLSDKSKGILQNPIVTYKEVLERSESDNTSNSEGNAITDDNSNFTTFRNKFRCKCINKKYKFLENIFIL